MLIKVRIVIILRGALTGRGTRKPFWAMETLCLGEWWLLTYTNVTNHWWVHRVKISTLDMTHKKIAKTIFKNYKPGGLELPDIKTEATAIKKA